MMLITFNISGHVNHWRMAPAAVSMNVEQLGFSVLDSVVI